MNSLAASPLIGELAESGVEEGLTQLFTPGPTVRERGTLGADGLYRKNRYVGMNGSYYAVSLLLSNNPVVVSTGYRPAPVDVSNIITPSKRQDNGLATSNAKISGAGLRAERLDSNLMVHRQFRVYRDGLCAERKFYVCRYLGSFWRNLGRSQNSGAPWSTLE